MVEGDTLRRYPVALDGDDVILDLSDPPGEARIAAALEEIREAMDKEEYDRMARRPWLPRSRERTKVARQRCCAAAWQRALGSPRSRNR